jgi:hypothetical protein
MIKNSGIRILSDRLHTGEIRLAGTVLLIAILTSVLVFFTANLDAQNRKPSFSQLDFDHTVRQKPKETPTPEPLNPLERILKDAKSTDNIAERTQKEPMKTPSNRDQKTQ